MLKPFALFTILLVCNGGLTAQAPDTAMSSVMLQSCFMGTPAEMWTRLKLTSDQLSRLEAIQEACKEECDLPDVKKEANTISHSNGRMVMTELKNILTMDQYAAWSAYCASFDKPGKAKAPK